MQRDRHKPDRIRRIGDLQIVYKWEMALEDTTTVRVRRPDLERLRVLAKHRQTTVIDVIHDAVDALERREFHRGLSDDYQRLQSDPMRWETFLRERDEWDSLA